jgi:hypothetical protein
MRIDRLRLDDAGIIHRGLDQLTGGFGGQDHLAPIGPDQPAILDKGLHRALIDGDVEQAVAGDVERHRIAGRQCDGA